MKEGEIKNERKRGGEREDGGKDVRIRSERRGRRKRKEKRVTEGTKKKEGKEGERREERLKES